LVSVAASHPSSAALVNTGFVYHPDYLLHDAGVGHPERAGRLEAIMTHLESRGLDKSLRLITPQAVSNEWLLEVHSARHVEAVRAASRDAPTQLDPDTRMSRDSFHVAKLAAGGTLAAVDAVMAGQVANAFAAVRPPGHHALPDRAMGFCLFNNVAVGARYVQRRYGVERVLIVDWDVHHGNGTQDIFYNDSTVLYFSTHQYPYYPGTGSAGETGAGAGKGATINAPLMAGAGDREIIEAFRQLLIPAVDNFRPQFVFISAGFDAHKDDPLAHLQVTEAGYQALTRIVLELAERYAQGRVVSVLEGGYDLGALARSVTAHIEELMTHGQSKTPTDHTRRD